MPDLSLYINNHEFILMPPIHIDTSNSYFNLTSQGGFQFSPFQKIFASNINPLPQMFIHSIFTTCLINFPLSHLPSLCTSTSYRYLGSNHTPGCPLSTFLLPLRPLLILPALRCHNGLLFYMLSSHNPGSDTTYRASDALPSR